MADAHERFVLIAMEEARQGGAEGNVAVPGIPARGDMTVLSTGMSAPGRLCLRRRGRCRRLDSTTLS